MGAHIFLVGENNFEVCIRRGIYGCVMPKKEWNTAEIIAGLLSVQVDDLVFFYVRNRGIYGLWKITSKPFFDPTPVWDNVDQTYPYRFTFESAVGNFKTPIILSDILDLHDRGLVWTFDLNPVQQKNQYKITSGEVEHLIRLLLRNNPLRTTLPLTAEPYTVSGAFPVLNADLSSSESGKIRYEGWLNAWFMQSFSAGLLKPLFGDYHEFINLVPTTYNKVMDIFLTHVETIGALNIPYKYTCIELKADKADEEDLAQVLRYEKWLARKLASGDYEMIQSVLVAHRFSEELIRYVQARRRIEEKTVRLISYKVVNGTIELQEIVP
jgi:hypothetical protein